MEYQLVCYDGVPLADAPDPSPYRDIVLDILRTISPDETSGRRKSFHAPNGATMHMDLRWPIVCVMICRTGSAIKDAYYMLEIMHSRVSTLFPPSRPFELQHTLGAMLPRLASSVFTPAEPSSPRPGHAHPVACFQSRPCQERVALLPDSIQSDSSICHMSSSQPSTASASGQCGDKNAGCSVCYILGWAAMVVMACAVVFLFVAAWIYFKDYF